MSKPLVAICGATGVQGGSVLQALLETGDYRLRGLTRNVSSDKAKALQEKGVEMVQADLANKDDLKRAFEGADIVYGVTNFWDPEILKNPSLEAEQGKNIADAAKENKVQWLIWSSAPSCSKGSGGKITEVKHFDGKNDVEEYIKSIGLSFTSVNIGCYMSNFGYLIPLVPNDDGTQSLPLPVVHEDTYIDLTDTASDTGPLVKAVLQNKDKYVGQRLPVVGDRLTAKQIADTYTKVTGKTTKFQALTKEALEGPFSYMNTGEFLGMFTWFRDFGYYGDIYGPNGSGALEATKSVGIHQTTFEEYLKKHAK
ncbi:hypothetical protein INT43_000085 [Umbelopsis isabellina]|uniref:NmrA-like domain-containing protein n=1 Tax=Mortierella isabellina TaxID=91625 RepID=A0A8H7PF46_MORIS|nr:hypothetical protein INT43_000085 [Umbelopsis isabellina]